MIDQEKMYDKLCEIDYLISNGEHPIEMLEYERDILEELLKGSEC